jgi:hypothetical protein
MHTKKSAQPTTDSASDRRQHPRIKLTGPIVGQPVGGGETFVVDEASLGGFSIRSRTPFDPESKYRFRLSSPSGQATVVAAVCRYCTATPGDGEREPATYVVGFQFLPQPTRRLRLILGAIAMDAL